MKSFALIRYVSSTRVAVARTFIASTIFFVFSAVTCFSQTWMNEEKDVVRGSQRVSFEISNSLLANRRLMGTLTQTYLKETKDSVAVYRIYDVLVLDGRCFDIDKNVYVIIDDQPFQLTPDYLENSLKTSLSEEQSKVLKSDSTAISVITGYNANNQKVLKASYKMPQLVIDKIMSATSIVFRYYAGPYLLTAKLTALDVRKLQRITKEI